MKMPILSSIKILLISTAVLSMAILLNLSVPVVTDFVVSEIPSIWSCFISWLRPPYLYLVMNCIIITIVASSKLNLDDSPEAIPVTDSPSPVTKNSSEISNAYSFNTNQYGLMKVEPRVLEMEKTSEDDSLIVSPITNGLQRKDSVGILFSDEMEKPPVSSRIGQRKSVKASPEGKALGVSKPKRQDTLESTWRAITDGRSMPLTRHLKKSDTWDSHARRNLPVDPTTPPSKMTKSETFSDRVNSPLSPSPGGSGKLKRESSLTQDELNRRVEAFINKFNEEMRLQRQDSLRQYEEMMGRAAAH